MEQKRFNERVIISGTPGGGKSAEGMHILHKLLTSSPWVPPILFTNAQGSRGALVCVRGKIFQIPDHHAFEQSWAYKCMRSEGPIWHIYDSTFPPDRASAKVAGPQLIITSPGKLAAEEVKFISTGSPCAVLYLPLPDAEEMEHLGSNMFSDKESPDYLSDEDMKKLIVKYGAVPRLIFNFGTRERDLNDLEEHLHTTVNVERLLTLVGISLIDHDVPSSRFVHIVPYRPASFKPKGSRSEEGIASETAPEAVSDANPKLTKVGAVEPAQRLDSD